MADYKLQKRMPDYAVSRKDILAMVRESDSSFREGQMKRLLLNMIETSQIEHVGRNKYRKVIEAVNRAKYENHYSEIGLQLIAVMQQEFPLANYRVWELSWYNFYERGSVKRNLAHSFCQFALNLRSMSKPPLFDKI